MRLSHKQKTALRRNAEHRRKLAEKRRGTREDGVRRLSKRA